MNLQNFMKRQENRVGHLANRLSSSRFSRNTTSQASSKDNFFPSQRFEFVPFFFSIIRPARKAKTFYCSFTGNLSICSMTSTALITTTYLVSPR